MRPNGGRSAGIRPAISEGWAQPRLSRGLQPRLQSRRGAENAQDAQPCGAGVGHNAGVRPRDAFEICHEVYLEARQVLDEKLGTVRLEHVADGLWRPDTLPRLGEFVADFALAGERALAGPRLASRLILFRLYFLGRAEYHAARRQMGIGELTWAQWADEIRERVGRELLRAGVFPPGRYFHERSTS